uniref:Uncharacterized protein n=1 Tax=Tetranychus urticae TaxID=32264 RepID=T1K621_TETUR
MLIQINSINLVTVHKIMISILLYWFCSFALSFSFPYCSCVYVYVVFDNDYYCGWFFPQEQN